MMQIVSEPTAGYALGVRRSGAAAFWLAQRLTFGAWVAGALLQVCLFIRPTPSGVPYVGEWQRYFFRALLYEGLENYLVALPFLAFWLLLYTRTPISPALRWVHTAQIAALGSSLFITQLDHEIMRFVGTRLTPSYLQVYATAATSWPIVIDSLLLDQGGPFLPLALWFGAPLAYAAWSRCSLKAVGSRWTSGLSAGVALASVCLPILAPLYVRQYLGGKGPTRRVEPVLFSVARDLTTSMGPVTEPPDFTRLVQQYQREWLHESADREWRFTSPDYPYIRQPARPMPERSPVEEPWNVVVFQLETFRAWNMGLTRTALPRPPTPFLDQLGRSDRGSHWTRHFSFGPPTVNGAVAWHCSLLPHSSELALTMFTYTELDCLPQAVRRHGYRAEIFTGFDPDWDNETLWYRRWYDQFNYYSDAAGHDQVLMRRSAARLKELGRLPQPFLATIVCITNHYPFSSVDPRQDVAGYATAADRILNTMHYTDTAAREFIESLRNEPWFDRTLFVFLSDHAYNLGEHTPSSGLFHLYRESTWVPLIIYGRHPRLAAGRHDEPASLLDVAPTLADLLDIRERTPWLGHSLVARGAPRASVVFERGGLAFAETADHSIVVDPDTETPRVFDPKSDPLQTLDLSDRVPPEIVRRMLQRAARQRLLNDYLIRANRVWSDAR